MYPAYLTLKQKGLLLHSAVTSHTTQPQRSHQRAIMTTCCGSSQVDTGRHLAFYRDAYSSEEFTIRNYNNDSVISVGMGLGAWLSAHAIRGCIIQVDWKLNSYWCTVYYREVSRERRSPPTLPGFSLSLFRVVQCHTTVLCYSIMTVN